MTPQKVAEVVSRLLRVGELQWLEDERICGRLVLPLPDIEELAKWLEEIAESEERMYG